MVVIVPSLPLSSNLWHVLLHFKDHLCYIGRM